MPASTGPFPLTDVGKLPNIARTHPGEHWSDLRAAGLVEPGAPIFPTAAPADDAGSGTPGGKPVVYTPGSRRWFKQVEAGDTPDTRQVALAMRTIEPPFQGEYPDGWGPNEVVNQDIPDGEYVHAWYSGAFILTLVKPQVAGYAPGTLLGWDPTAVRPVSKRGPAADRVGCWTHASDVAVVAGTDILEIIEWDEHNSTTHEGSVEVRTLRSQHI